MQAKIIESIHIFSFKKLWVECAVCAMCAGENNRHIYSCHSGWFGLMWVECAVCAVCAGENNRWHPYFFLVPSCSLAANARCCWCCHSCLLAAAAAVADCLLLLAYDDFSLTSTSTFLTQECAVCTVCAGENNREHPYFFLYDAVGSVCDVCRPKK